MVNFQEVNFNFDVLVVGIIQNFLSWLKGEGFEFKDELQVVFASYFALLELRTATDKLIKKYEKLPVFEGLEPEKAYQVWLKSQKEKKVVKFKRKGESDDGSRSS